MMGGNGTKTYDRAYFDRWYRSSQRVVTPQIVRRKAHLALSAAEYLLGREVRTVLDVGCGEGQWRGVLRRMRPGLRWTGVDSSAYVVQRYGARRGIRQCDFGALGSLRLRGPFDLIVCSDVLHYIGTAELRAGLPALASLLRGVAWLEAFTVDDEIGGDRVGWHMRRPAQYSRLFGEAGLVPAGLNCWVPADWAGGRLGSMERP